MNNPVAPIKLVTCPTCKGKKAIRRPANSFDPRGKQIVQPCISCKHTGIVEADRVCSTCGQFLQNCQCPPKERNVTVLKLAPRLQPNSPAQPESTQEKSEMAINPATGRRTYHRHSAGDQLAAGSSKAKSKSALAPTPPLMTDAPAQDSGPSLRGLIKAAQDADEKAEHLRADAQNAVAEAQRLADEATLASHEAAEAWGRVEQRLAPMSSPEAEALRYLISHK